jgi:hypothetical protein
VSDAHHEIARAHLRSIPPHDVPPPPPSARHRLLAALRRALAALIAWARDTRTGFLPDGPPDSHGW